MDPDKQRIYIVGAGVSGLAAARVLEQSGYRPVVLEATDSPGGRVKTDHIRGAVLDHGFQVLLTDYPMAKKYLDYPGLRLHRFRPGALVFFEGRSQRIGDPLRDPASLWPTLVSVVGTLQDKWKIFTLSNALKRKSLEAIFSAPEQTTRDYLEAYGFSSRIINRFFQPFFTGIFLETDLRTSSRMFEFTFKMFSQGYAALPEAGIGAIPAQMAGSLRNSEVRYGQAIRRVRPGEILLANGKTLPADAVVCTIPLDAETGEIRPAVVRWKRCDNLYFTVPARSFPEGIIGLVADPGALVNNLYYPFGQQAGGHPVLSVTVVRSHDFPPEELARKVAAELQEYCDIDTGELLRHYAIDRALPDLDSVALRSSPKETPIADGVFAAGDYRLNGSLNAAMASGEAAARAVLARLKP